MSNPLSYFERFYLYPEVLKFAPRCFLTNHDVRSLDEISGVIVVTEPSEDINGEIFSSDNEYTILELAQYDLLSECNKVIQKVRETILMLSDDECNNYIKRILQQITTFIAKIDTNTSAKVDYYKQVLYKLKAELALLYASVEKGDQTKKKKNADIFKLRWLGKRNVLATLFYDLMVGQGKIPKQIDATKNEVLAFILGSFVDEQGNPFAKDSIETYLRPERGLDRTSNDKSIKLKE